MLHDELARQEAEAEASQHRQNNFVAMVVFPNALTPLRYGAPGASHHRIPADDLHGLAATIHEVRGSLAGGSLCIRLGRTRYEVLLQNYAGKLVCPCNVCVKARCMEASRRLGMISLELSVRDL